MNNIIHTIERKPSIAQAAPARHSTLRAAAQSLSLRNVDQAAVELMAEALNRLTMLCYEVDDDGTPCNVDVRGGGRLLVPAPWGRGGHKRWGLTPSEANIMRALMLGLMLGRQQRGKAAPLMAYDGMRKCWYLNIFDFPSYEAALAYLERWPLTIQEYRGARDHALGKT
jgi:hypothetical protein